MLNSSTWEVAIRRLQNQMTRVVRSYMAILLRKAESGKNNSPEFVENSPVELIIHLRMKWNGNKNNPLNSLQ